MGKVLRKEIGNSADFLINFMKNGGDFALHVLSVQNFKGECEVRNYFLL